MIKHAKQWSDDTKLITRILIDQNITDDLVDLLVSVGKDGLNQSK